MMNRKTAKDFLPIFTAFAEGKEIQVLLDTSNVGEVWAPADHINVGFKYRIKPSAPEYCVVKRPGCINILVRNHPDKLLNSGEWYLETLEAEIKSGDVQVLVPWTELP